MEDPRSRARARRGASVRARRERGAGRRGGLARAGTATGIAALAGLLLAVGPLQGQRLEEYDYENLRLRGVGAEVFFVSPNDVDGTLGVGVRVDLGFLGPKVRVMPRIAFWDSELTQEAVNRLETKLADLIQEQNPGQPRPDIDLGTIDQEAFIVGSDLHWLPLVDVPLRPYLGVGGEIYFLNGSGDAIEDTFVEDRLDLLTAGVSGVAGLEYQLRGGLLLYGEVRGSLVADVRNVALTVGVGYVAR